jgi:hypothetical protein
MKERGMLFSAPMVLALLNGSKTQTRRVMKPQPPKEAQSFCTYHHPDPRFHHYAFDGDALMDFALPCPYGQPGDRLWVRETARVLRFKLNHDNRERRAHIRYEADGEESSVLLPDRLKPILPGHCVPNGCHREAARILLKITSVRVERLQDISDDAALAEGVISYPVGNLTVFGVEGTSIEKLGPRAAYLALWNEINGRGASDANPWVWVIEFRRVKP